MGQCDAIVVALGLLVDHDHHGECCTSKLTTGEEPGRARPHGGSDGRLLIVRSLLEEMGGAGVIIQPIGETGSTRAGGELQCEVILIVIALHLTDSWTGI